MWMMKKQTVVALVLMLLIPVVSMLCGLLFLINPEIAAGHSNYVRNYHLLNLVKNLSFLASGAVVGILWLLVCALSFSIARMANPKGPNTARNHAGPR